MDDLYGPYNAIFRDAHDGDTIHLDIDLGFSHGMLSHKLISGKPDLSCRIWGINAPELATQEGKDALAFLNTLLKPGDVVKVVSHNWDKYGGRFDGSVTLPDGSDLASAMIKAGHAVPLTV